MGAHLLCRDEHLLAAEKFPRLIFMEPLTNWKMEGLEPAPDSFTKLWRQASTVSRRVALATGVAAFPLLQELTGAACERFPGLAVQVEAVENQFFGPRIQVAGLVTGRDLLCTMQEKQQPGTEVLLIPQVMLRYEGDLFLDDVSLPVEETLGVPVLSPPTAGGTLDALLENELYFAGMDEPFGLLSFR